jgi:multidrug resistance efflux pump
MIQKILSSTPVPRVWLPFLVWAGIGLLVASVAGIAWGLHLPASPSQSVPSPGSAGAARTTPRLAVCFGYVDAEFGPLPLSPQQSGRIVKVLVKENQVVEAHQPLLELDPTLARATLAQAEAELKAAQAQLEQARQGKVQHAQQITGQEAVVRAKKHELELLNLKRVNAKHLVDEEPTRTNPLKQADEGIAIVQATIQAEEARLAALKAIDPQLQVQRAEQAMAARAADVTKAQFALNECTLAAPSAGTVLRVLVNAGETLGGNPRQPAVYFEPRGKRFIRAEIEQEFADRVVLHGPAQIQDDTRSGPRWKGQVIHISNWFTHRRSMIMEPLQFNDVRTLECWIELDPATPPLRIGQRVRVILDGMDS